MLRCQHVVLCNCHEQDLTRFRWSNSPKAAVLDSTRTCENSRLLEWHDVAGRLVVNSAHQLAGLTALNVSNQDFHKLQLCTLPGILAQRYYSWVTQAKKMPLPGGSSPGMTRNLPKATGMGCLLCQSFETTLLAGTFLKVMFLNDARDVLL